MENQKFLNFGLRFNLRQTRENKPTIIYAVFVCNGIQHKVNTMLKVYPEHWDNKVAPPNLLFGGKHKRRETMNNRANCLSKYLTKQ